MLHGRVRKKNKLSSDSTNLQAQPSTTMIRPLCPPSSLSFLGLPLELRQHIYEEMLDLPATDHISLLCVCRQTLHEGSMFFYRRTLICGSQDELYRFTTTHRPETLRCITSLNITFREVDPAVMQPALAMLVMGLPIDSRQHPYFREIEKVTKGLLSMRNVKHLSVLTPNERTRNPPSRDFFESIFSWIRKNYTQLHSLHTAVETTSVSFLSALRNLRSIHCSGFSTTSPEEMLGIVTKLKQLEELKLVAPPRSLRRRQRYGHQQRVVVQSFTDTVVRSMRPLKRLTIFEVAESAHDQPAFLTGGFLKAVYLTHRNSLREIHLMSDMNLDATAVTQLRVLLRSTTVLITLRIGWPAMDIRLFQHLPTTLQHLEVMVSELPIRQPSMEQLRLLAARSPHLQQIRLNTMEGDHPLDLLTEHCDTDMIPTVLIDNRVSRPSQKLCEMRLLSFTGETVMCAWVGRETFNWRPLLPRAQTAHRCSCCWSQQPQGH